MAVALAAMFVALVWAPAASATSDPLASGATNLHLKKGFKKKLRNINVNVVKWGSGRVQNKSVVNLVVNGGSLDPTNGAGTVENGGGFKFKYKKRTVPVTELEVDTANRSVFAKVANARMKFGTLSDMSYVRNGFGTDLTSKKLKLTGKAAKRINNKLGMSKQQPLRGGRVMSNSWSTTQPSTVAVLASGLANLNTSGETVRKFSLAPPSGFLVRIEPIAPATATAGPTIFEPILNFPIGGGTIAPDASAGTVQTTGGVNLVQDLGMSGKTTMTLDAIWVDLSTKVATVDVTISSTVDPQLNLGPLGRISIANLDLTGATIGSNPAGRTVTILNANATLQAVTAETLNSVFGAPWDALRVPHPTFAEGDPLGTFSFTAQTQ